METSEIRFECGIEKIDSFLKQKLTLALEKIKHELPYGSVLNLKFTSESSLILDVRFVSSTFIIERKINESSLIKQLQDMEKEIMTLISLSRKEKCSFEKSAA